MPTLLLVRHGQASFGGADYDVLSELGAVQSAAVAAELTSRHATLGPLVSGSLRRQRDTAAPLAAALGGAEVAVDAGWDEYAMDGIVAAHSGSSARAAGGTISSREFQDVLDSALRDWMAAGSATSAPESWPAFAARTTTALRDLAASVPSGATGVAVTSGGVLAALAVALMDLPQSAFLTFNRVAVNASVTKVIVGRRGATLVSYNEHGHLERAGAGLVTYR